MDILEIKGIGEKMLDVLKKMNIITLGDLITYYPYRYNVIKVININSASDDLVVTVRGIVESVPKVSYISRKLNRMSFVLNSDGVLVNVTIFNRSFYKNNLTIGRVINVVGKYNRSRNSFTANDIKFEIIRDMKIESVYHMKNGIKRATLVKVIEECLKMRIDLEDFIPDYLREKYGFIDKFEAAKLMHFPDSVSDIKKAKLRIIYEEFFIFMFKMGYLKYKYDLEAQGLSRDVPKGEVQKFIESLPYELTIDQNEAVEDIYNDLVGKKRMNRLVLGDVGSGKTCVAFVGLYINYLSGYQGAIMAPTEILARQHYENAISFFASTGLRVELLVGSMKKREKDNVCKRLALGEVDVLIGTHAIISEQVEFLNLGLVVTDEQHRFGVNQRSNLQNKGTKCDVLYLSATPIPRTYALTIYGDLDTSIIKTKPMGRKEIITKVYSEKELRNVLVAMYEEIKKGYQVYVVAPLIEDEEGESDLNDVVKLKEKFKMAFNDKVSIEILHGKMKNKDKDDVMTRFKDGDIQVLISTTVIEVGVDVKNSTMMVIFNAERFGLATLHQLRGRVGRNELQSYCFLVCNMSIERLKVMEESNDGFYISQRDFELRGEGDLFGTRQSGDMVFKVGDIKRDYKILMQCKEDVKTFIEENVVDNFHSYQQFKGLIGELEFID